MAVWKCPRLKVLEAENAKLKSVKGPSPRWGGESPDHACGAHARRRHTQGNAGKKLLKPGARKRAVDWTMTKKNYNQRRACALAGLYPRVYRRRSSKPEGQGLRQRLKELSGERRRFGYRRLHVLRNREGWKVNWKKLYRIHREEGLTVRKRGGRKRAIGTRAPIIARRRMRSMLPGGAIPQGPNQRWSLDPRHCLSDQWRSNDSIPDSLSDGRRFRVLCVIDDFCRECLACVVDTSLSGQRVARGLDNIAQLCGYPCMVVSDNGTELTSNAILKWQEGRKASGTTMPLASQCKTASWKASMADCETSA